MPKDQNSRNTDKDALLANVALLYYGEGLTQGDIAGRMKVSRATVVNLLREARESGIVDIRVDGRSLAGSTLCHELRDKFGLADAYVATLHHDDQPENRAEMLRHLGRVGAIALTEIVEPGDALGVAWGETIRAVSEHMSRTRTDGVSVRQMIGSMISDSVPASESCTIQIANMLSADCYTLHAPALVSSAEVAALFRSEPTLRQQLRQLKSLDMTVASIGHVGEDTHLARAGIVTKTELRTARKAGAVGVLCSRFIDRQGKPISVAPDDRLIAVDLKDLRRPKKRLLVVGGADRADAVLGAIRGGYVTHLCVDRTLAHALLAAR